jgi:hypothetical protein
VSTPTRIRLVSRIFQKKRRVRRISAAAARTGGLNRRDMMGFIGASIAWKQG